MRAVTNAAEVKVLNIPKSDLDGVAGALLSIAESVMAQPEMQKRFEAWKKKRGVSNAACSM